MKTILALVAASVILAMVLPGTAVVSRGAQFVVPSAGEPRDMIWNRAPNAEILGNLNVSKVGSLENATQMTNAFDWTLAGPAGNYTDYSGAMYAANEAGTPGIVRGIAQTSYPDPKYLSFVMVGNLTAGVDAPDMIIALPRECPHCNIGNTMTGNGIYIRGKAYVYDSGKCRALDGTDSLNLTLVRVWLI